MKKAKKNAIELTKTSLILGTGSSVVTSIGGNAAGLKSFSSGLKPAGTILGSKLTLKQVKKLGGQ